LQDNDGTDDDGSIDNSFVLGKRGDQGDDDDDDESNGSHNTGDIHDNVNQFAYDDEGDEEVVRYDPDLLLFNDSDATHEITQDNIVQDHEFFTTNAGDSSRDVLHHDRMEWVSEHVISTRLLFARKDMEGHKYLACSNKGTLFKVLHLLHLIAQAHCSTWSLHCSIGSSSMPPPLMIFLSLVPYPYLRTA
jgi:hypothetical protein